jgi:hypothetical protein
MAYFSPSRLRGMQKKGRGSCTCNRGHKHHSRLEAGHCPIVHAMDDVVEVKVQVNFPLVVNGIKICSHIVDFVQTFKDGHKEVVESKGFVNETWPMKHKLFVALYPDIKYNVWDR